MHILIGLVLVLALLYFWMSAHWFVRIVAFVLISILSCGIIAACDAYPNRGFALPFALVLSWLIASIPTYRARYLARGTSREATRRGMEMLHPGMLTQPPSYTEMMAKHEAAAAAFRKEHGIPDPPTPTPSYSRY
jgi:multisubunit Na+/H+ antiporter MnhF subunit